MTAVGITEVALVVEAHATGAVGFWHAGAALAVTVATTAYAVAAVTFLLWVTAPAPVVVGLLVAMGVAAAAIRATDPSGPVIGLFLIMAFAPLRLPLPQAGAVAVASALLFDLQLARTAQNPAVFIAVTTGGAGFFFLMGWLVRREHELRRDLEATRDAEREAAALQERARLARELHDVLAHTLSGLTVQLEGARLLARARDTDQQVLRALDDAHHLAKAGLADARRAVSTLRGDDLPGPELIPDLVEQHRATGGSCTVNVIGTPRPLAADARLALFRAAQEALTNIRKHAPTASAELDLRWSEDSVRLVVSSTAPVPTPVGAAPASVDTRGYGLTGLSERAQLLGGQFHAGASAEGFRVELTVPVAP